MKSFKACLYCEILKLKRSGIFWITIVFFMVVPLMFGLMMFIAQKPELSAKLGLIGTKAKLFGTNDWKGYFSLLIQMVGTIGLIGFGFVTSWVFGSEYSNRTIKDMLALPISRTYIVIAKFTVILFWCLLLILILYLISFIMGLLLHLPGRQPELIYEFSKRFLNTTLLSLLLCTPVGFLASYSRGIIGPLGFVIVTLILAQFAGLTGLGPFFPWAIPGIYSVSQNAEGLSLVTASYFILLITSLSGFFGTILWWKNADQH